MPQETDNLSGRTADSSDKRLASETLKAVLAALITGTEQLAVDAVNSQDSMDPEVKEATLEILQSRDSRSDRARRLGDLLRSRYAGERGYEAEPLSNECYRAAFYLGQSWSDLATNPLFARFNANKAWQPYDKWIHYFEIYRRNLQRFVGKAPRVLEIGVYHGGGLDALRAFLGPEAHLIGLDLEPSARAACSGRHEVIVGDQSDAELLRRIVEEHGPFDIIIDDGGHYVSQQIASIEALFPTVRAGGVYLVEDTHTSYWPTYQDGDKTFMDWAKDRMDDVNAYHHSVDEELPSWTLTVGAIHIYDSVVVFDKEDRYAPFAEVAGTGSAFQGSRPDENALLLYRAAADLQAREAQEATRHAAEAEQYAAEAESAASAADAARLQAQEELEIVHTSNSWRITRPLRYLGRKKRAKER